MGSRLKVSRSRRERCDARAAPAGKRNCYFRSRNAAELRRIKELRAYPGNERDARIRKQRCNFKSSPFPSSSAGNKDTCQDAKILFALTSIPWKRSGISVEYLLGKKKCRLYKTIRNNNNENNKRIARHKIQKRLVERQRDWRTNARSDAMTGMIDMIA